MSAAWPPPPDLASMQELMRAADPERLLEGGAPADEYDLEERELLKRIGGFSTEQMLATNILPVLEEIWQRSFSLNTEQLAHRAPSLLSLSKEIERFFGPSSKPRTRSQILEDNESPHD